MGAGSSSNYEGDFKRIRKGFAVLQAIGEHAKSEGLRRRKGGVPCRAVHHDSGKIGDIRDPAAIDFTFQLDSQAHAPRIPCAWAASSAIIFVFPGTHHERPP